jgi:hypothetical protein
MQLASRDYELFKGSEVDEKRQIIKLVLFYFVKTSKNRSNLRVKDGRVLWNAIKPFDLIAKSSDCSDWLGREDSNLRMTVPKTVALPLGDAPRIIYRS